MRSSSVRLPVAALAALFFIAPLAAQQDNNNAATWYQKAIDAYKKMNLDWEADLRPVLEEFLNNPQIGPSPEAQRTIARLQPVLDMAARGGAQEYADFNLDYQQGYELLLPHLAEMRQITRLMSADAMARVHAGDPAGAAARIGATYDMSGHLTGDRLLISSLVGNAIFNVGEETIQYGLDREVFSAGEAAQILRSIEDLDGFDPFGMLESVAMEAELATSWFDGKFEEGADAEEIGTTLVAMLSGGAADEQQIEFWSGLDQAGFDEQLSQYEQFMDRMVDAFHIEDPEAAQAEFARLQDELESGEHGDLSKLITPALGRIHERLLESRETVAARKAMLRELAQGQTLPSEHANAVTYYLRAIEIMEQYDTDALEALRKAADGGDVADDEALAKAVSDLQPAVDLVREGSLKRRCDFTQYRPLYPVMIGPPYAAGLHDLLRLLQLDASRAAASGDTARLVDRLAVTYRFTGHIATDDQLMSCAIAHDGFARTMSILEQAIAAGAIDDAGRNQLYSALQRVTRTDPFGYINAVAASRKRMRSIASMLWYEPEATPEVVQHHAAVLTLADEWSAIRLLHLAAIMEHAWLSDLMPARTSPSFNEKSFRYVTDPDDLARLGDLIDEQALAAARDDTLLILNMFTRGELDLVTAQPVHDVFDLSRRLPQARADLRGATGLLRPAPITDESDE